MACNHYHKRQALDADLIARAEAAKAEWAARPDDTTKRMVEYYTALQKVDPAVIVERGRKIRAILDGEDVKVVAPKKERPPMTVWPASLRLDQAAEYCGLSEETFKKVCLVKPIEFTESSRGHRYLKASLDNWLCSLDKNAQPSSTGRRFGEKLGGQGEARGA